MAKRFDAATEAAIIVAYLKGSGGRELARRFGVGSSSIYRVLRRHDVAVREWSPRPNKFSKEVEAEIAGHYAAGKLSSHIAQTFGCSPGLVREIAKRHGAASREHGGQIKRWTDEHRADMVARYTAGESQESIAAHHGTSQISVSRMLRQYGVTRKRGRGRWKGGRTMCHGYVGVLVDDTSPYAAMRNNMGYVLEHRLVMAQQLGRPLTKHETVHHINGDRTDNRPENLQVRRGKHGAGQVFVCADCGSRNVTPVPLEASP